MTDIEDWLVQLQDASFTRANRATVESYPPKRRLSGQRLAELLDARRNVVIASTRPDGRAHAAPGSFLVADRAVWLPTVTGAQRIRNVAAHPWLSMVLAEGEGARHAMVLFEGPAAEVPDVPDTIRALTAARNRGDVSWVGTWLRMDPRRLFSFATKDWTL